MKLEIELEHEPFLINEDVQLADIPEWVLDMDYIPLVMNRYHIIFENRLLKTIKVALNGDYIVALFDNLIVVSREELDKCISPSAD